jgi:phosphate transport system ATP-binding protein
MEERIDIKNLNLFYGHFQALKNINLSVPENMITAIIGPSGCGKSTLLRCLNRMNDLIEEVRYNGEIFIDGENVLSAGINLVKLRKKIGMVFQRPNPFPFSIYENITYGPKVHGIHHRKKLAEIVEGSLRSVGLWDFLKDRLDTPAMDLSLGDQQRLCIARLLAVDSEIILLDEPCSALDPRATLLIEDLMRELKKKYTIFIVTHNMQQAARVSDVTAFMLLGDLIEYGQTSQIFTAPKDKRTDDYITGRFG